VSGFLTESDFSPRPGRLRGLFFVALKALCSDHFRFRSASQGSA